MKKESIVSPTKLTNFANEKSWKTKWVIIIEIKNFQNYLIDQQKNAWSNQGTYAACLKR